MPRPKRHPQRRASDPGHNGDGKDFSFFSFRQVLAWLIGLLVVLIPSLLWTITKVSEGVVSSHETVEQKELVARIEAVRTDLSSKMTTQWQMFYTKPEVDARRAELDRRLAGIEAVGSEVTKQQMAMQQTLATQTAILETIKARQQDSRR